MNIASLVRRVVREGVIRPIAGRLLNRGLRWIREADGWEGLVSAVAHVMIEDSGAVVGRTHLAELIADFKPYLSSESLQVLLLIDEIARRHSSEAN